MIHHGINFDIVKKKGCQSVKTMNMSYFRRAFFFRQNTKEDVVIYIYIYIYIYIQQNMKEDVVIDIYIYIDAHGVQGTKCDSQVNKKSSSRTPTTPVAMISLTVICVTYFTR